ncbi:methyltransferase [uncultured Pseudonocardia sp.]|uniref:methyltransferase n=1 Tax=uncultured Pseudonocardia sp. TaxID=211455 RepID=UPI0026342431|nr:methyltransferase [uncultured Pseudonocardia sp.]
MTTTAPDPTTRAATDTAATENLDTSTSAGIIRLGNAFCDAQAVLTAVTLGLFPVLHVAPATETEIRERLQLDGRGLGDFLNLLVALGLLERTPDGGYANAVGADLHLVPGEPAYIGGFLLRSAHNLYPAWGRLGDALRTGEPQSGADYMDMIKEPTRLRQFIGMMDGLTQVLGPELAAAVDWASHDSLLDVGGCRGNMLAQILAVHPNLTGAVFDLPEMAPFFAEHQEELGLSDRTTFHAGSFLTDDVTATADVVMVGHVLHDWDAPTREMIVGKCWAAVRPGGTLVIYDRMLDDAAPSIENLVISLDMLLVTPGGSEYPAQEVTGYADALGATGVTVAPLGDYDTLVVCHKPA